MKTKLQIIQQLLDDRKINAEEAIILMQSEKEYVYVPQTTFPYYPPYNPYPFYTTSGDLIVNTDDQMRSITSIN